MPETPISKLSGALKNASARIAEADKPMASKAKEALGVIPEGVYYDPEEIVFFGIRQDSGDQEPLPPEFFEQWHSRWEEFPQRSFGFTPPAEQIDSTIPDIVDTDALAAEVYDFSHLGPPNEFTARRTERLRQDMEEIKAEVAKIDAEINHLNARRTNAMLAYSGISADLTAMEK